MLDSQNNFNSLGRTTPNTKILGNNPRLARDVIISFVIFNKNTLNMFNLDIGSVLNYFLVYSVRMFDFLVFSVKTKKYYYLFIFML